MKPRNTRWCRLKCGNLLPYVLNISRKYVKFTANNATLLSISVQCVSSTEHKGHEVFDMTKTLKSQKKVFEKDLHELEKYIYPKYQNTAATLIVQKADLNKNSKKVATAIDKHGTDLHTEIDSIFQ